MIIVLLGSLIGFGTAVTAYALYDASLLAALAIWALSGPASVLLVAVSNALSQSGTRRDEDGTIAQSRTVAETA